MIIKKNYSQSQTAQGVAHMLTIGREGGGASDKRTQSAPQNLQLRKRHLPSACVFLNQLRKRYKEE